MDDDDGLGEGVEVGTVVAAEVIGADGEAMDGDVGGEADGVVALLAELSGVATEPALPASVVPEPPCSAMAAPTTATATAATPSETAVFRLTLTRGRFPRREVMMIARHTTAWLTSWAIVRPGGTAGFGTVEVG